ncbi:MAG: serine/threonine protein kinase [Lachnospiraceae bacterium]|nr:serine/threonine protein kinase [Lachnospiraceae bacterium]
MKQIWKQRYQIMEKLGQGGGGSVFKVWDIHLEKVWTIKFIDISAIEMGIHLSETNVEEWEVLKTISHPNFPRIVDAFEEDGQKVIVMDYIRGVTLENVICQGSIEEKQMISVAKQVCDALHYLHQCVPPLLYLDLKPANIMIEENGTIKLIDLGSVSVKGKQGSISGTFGFASPEQISGEQRGSKLTEQTDVFSFGMVLYTMLVGNCNRLPVVDGSARRGIAVKEKNRKVSAAVEKIIEKCTRGNGSKRYFSMREVMRDLELWEKKMKKINWFWQYGFKRKDRQWYQEKSILCTEGSHSFYIAKRLLILAFFLCGFLFPKEKLRVVLRDQDMKKILVRQGCAYETKNNVLLEIPWEEIEGDNCRIIVECKDHGFKKKRFYIDCILTN